MKLDFEDMRDDTELALNNDQSKKKKKMLLIIIIFLLLLICVVGGIIFWRNRNSGQDSTTKYWFDKMAVNGELAGKTPAEIESMLGDVVEKGMYNIAINASPIFQDGKSEGSLGIQNGAENLYYCRVVLTKDDDGTVIYESSGIKPGQYIDKVTLSKELPAGNYPCTAAFIITDPDTFEDIGQANVKVTVNILN